MLNNLSNYRHCHSEHSHISTLETKGSRNRKGKRIIEKKCKNV